MFGFEGGHLYCCRTRAEPFAWGLGAVGVILGIDLILPEPWAAFLYAIPVLLTMRWSLPWPTFITAAVSTALVVCPFLLLPANEAVWPALANRLLAVAAIWLTGFICLWPGRRSLSQTGHEAPLNLSKVAQYQLSALDHHALLSVTDAKGIITDVNEKFCEVSGYSRTELIGQNHRIIKTDEHPPEYFGQMWRAIFKGKAWRGDVRNRRRDGTTYWVDASIVPIIGDEGRTEGFVSIQLDITGRKRLEQEWREHSASLEKANHELHEAIVKTESATEAKSQFLANMSHEIRTPLTAIFGYAEMLRDEGDIHLAPPQRTQAIDTILCNGNHLLEIINDILDLSRIESGRMEVERIACSPVKIIREVEDLLRPRYEEKKLSLDVVFRWPMPRTVQSDPTRLKQILLNLLGNAAKFTHRGGVRLEVGVAKNDHRESQLQIDIIDTGIGMTDDQAVKVFQPFLQAERSTTRKFGGSGLGLSISRRVARLLGGDVTIVKTKPGGGSHFRATVSTGSLEGVAMIQSHEDQPDEAPSDRLTPTDPGEKLACRLLLAEDSADNARLISFFFTSAGAEVTVVQDGRCAVERALLEVKEGHPYDVILMDMEMPIMDGYAATACLREQGYTGTIIALTANAMASDRDRCLGAGCDAYATKPINRKQLLETVRTHLAATCTGASSTP